MPLDHDMVGVESEPVEVSWTSTDTLLYALGVGAGLDDPTAELTFTTENSTGISQRVLPTFAVLTVQRAPRPQVGDFNRAGVVHAEQAFELSRALPPAGTLQVSSTVTGIYDKGSGALVVLESRGIDPQSGAKVLAARSALFIRGEGGFGGDRGPSSAWDVPDRSPDHQVTLRTRPEQALLYRLSGDRNPLHSDPAFAARAGFERPILHGLCTYGVTGRALLRTLADSDPDRFTGMSGRFSAPVLPGEELTVSIWVDEGSVRFRTTRPDGTVVLDRGSARITID